MKKIFGILALTLFYFPLYSQTSPNVPATYSGTIKKNDTLDKYNDINVYKDTLFGLIEFDLSTFPSGTIIKGVKLVIQTGPIAQTYTTITGNTIYDLDENPKIKTVHYWDANSGNTYADNVTFQQGRNVIDLNTRAAGEIQQAINTTKTFSLALKGSNAGTEKFLFLGATTAQYGPFLLLDIDQSGLYPEAKYISDKIKAGINENIKFTNQSTNSPTKYNWDFDADHVGQKKSTLSDPVISYSESGIYSVSLTVDNGNGANTIVKRKSIQIFIPPIANFSFKIDSFFPSDYYFKDLSLNSPDSLIWDFGDSSAISNEKNPYHVFSKDGEFEVCLRAINLVGEDTFCQKVQVVTVFQGINTVSTKSASLFPNPSSGNIMLQINNNIEKTFVEIIDLYGKKIFSKYVNSTSIEINNLPKGIFQLKIQGPHYLELKKFIVE